MLERKGPKWQTDVYCIVYSYGWCTAHAKQLALKTSILSWEVQKVQKIRFKCSIIVVSKQKSFFSHLNLLGFANIQCLLPFLIAVYASDYIFSRDYPFYVNSYRVTWQCRLTTTWRGWCAWARSPHWGSATTEQISTATARSAKRTYYIGKSI